MQSQQTRTNLQTRCDQVISAVSVGLLPHKQAEPIGPEAPACQRGQVGKYYRQGRRGQASKHHDHESMAVGFASQSQERHPKCETPAWAGSTALIRKWHAKKAHRTRIECSSLHAPSLYFHALTIILPSLQVHLHLLLPSSRD